MYRFFNRSFSTTPMNDTPAIAHRIRLRHLVIAVCGCALLMFLMVRPAFAQTPSGTIDVSFDNRFASGLYFGTQVRTLNFYVKLSTAPNANVTVSITNTNTDVSFSPSTLTFTPSNFSANQTVVVTVTEDSDFVHDSDTLTLTATGGITAPAKTVTANIQDGDVTWEFDPPGGLTITEGTETTIRVRLPFQPTSDVGSNFGLGHAKTYVDTRANNAGYQTSWSFVASTWDQWVTIRVVAEEEDDDYFDDTSHISVNGDRGAGGGLYESASALYPITILDNDDNFLEITPAGTLTITEGDSTGGSFSVVYGVQPSAMRDVTVALTNTNSDVTLSPTSLTFTSTNYSTAQMVTVTAAQDVDVLSETDTVTFRATITNPPVGTNPAVVVLKAIDTKTVSITDDDTPPSPLGNIVVTPAGDLNINEGDSTGATLSVSLSAAPNAAVTVSLAVPSNSDVSLSNTSLNFTTTNYATAQTVTVTADEDTNTAHETVTLTLSATGGITASNVTKTVNVTDNDKPSGIITVTPAGTLNIDEGDSSGGTLSVTLSAAPNANVTVALAKTNPDVTLTPASLTFTPSNYSTAQMVTVTAGQDNDTTDETDTITLSATGGISAVNVTKAVAIDDDELPAGAIEVTPAGALSIDEGDSTGGTLSVKLSVQPDSDVTVALAKTNADVTLTPTSLTFTSNNYSTAQMVTVTAADDSDSSSETDTITFSISPAGGITAPNVTKAVNIADNDAPAGNIVVTPAGDLNIDEGDSTGATLSVSLSAAPNADVTVSLAVPSNSGVSLTHQSLNFNTTNYATAKMVTVTAGEDNNTAHETVTITLSATGGITASNVTKTVNVTDNDKPSGTINVTPAGTLDIDEGDSTGADISVSLSTAPNANVTVSLSSDNSDVSLSPIPLTFTPSNYSTAQAVTVSSGQDADTTDDTATITLSATGGITAPDVTKAVAIDDDEPPAGVIEVTPAGDLDIDEEDSTGGTLSIKLSAQPESDVTVSLTKTNADITLTPASLTFTSGNYSTAKDVTVTAAADNDASDDTDTITISATGGITAPNVTKDVNIEDNDSPSGSIEVTPAGALTIPEDTSATLSIKLDSQPDSDVTVSLTKTNADITLTPTSLTFTSGNYSAAQTVTVAAEHDTDSTDDTDTITISATGGITAANVTRAVTVTDDDNPQGTINVTPSGTLTIDEGDATGGTLSVTLSVAPKSDVTVSLTKTNAEVTISPSSLTFTASDHSTAQTITVKALDDADSTDDTDTITFTVTAGGIEAPAVTKAVSVTDDDLPPGTIQVNPAGTLTIDEGGSGTLTVKLSAAPKSDVTVSLSKNNSDVTLSHTSLTFTPTDYSTAQTITVSAAEDDLDNDHDTDIITFSATGGIEASDVTKAVTITDNEAPDPPPSGRIVLSSATGVLLINEGATGSFTVHLSAVPDSNVTVSLSSTNTDVTLSTASLTFTTTDSDVPQTVIVSAAEDDDMSGDFDTITIEASGGIIASPVKKNVTIADNDRNPPGNIILSGTRFPPIAEGDSVSIRVSLSAPPDGITNVSLKSDIPALILSPSSLTFTASNFSDPQSVTLTAQEDEDALDETTLVAVEAQGGIDAPALTRSFLIIDNDKPPTLPPGDNYAGTLVVAPAARLDIEEESEGVIEVRLSSQPVKNVSVLITKTGFGIGLSRGSMTFTPSNWDEDQTVRVSAHADSDKNDSAHFIAFAFEDKRVVREVFVTDNDKELPRTQALALPPVGSGDEAVLRIQCKHATPCHVALDCSTQADGLVLEGTLPEPIPAHGTVSLTPLQIQRYTGGNSWAGRGRLGCTLRSSQHIGSQVWTRSGDGVLVNNSAMIRSVMEGDLYRADIESIPSPDAFDESNIRIRCNSAVGDCLDTVFVCYQDDGTRHTWELGQIDRRTTRHLQSEELATGIDHRWEGLGLSCELRSKGMFTVQVLTRTGGGGALVNNSATGEVLTGGM